MSLSVVNKQQRAGRWSCKGVQPAPAESCRHSGIWISFCTGWFHSGKLFVYCIVTYNAYTERCNVQIVIRCAVVESNARQKIEPCPTPEPPAYPLSLKATFPPSVVNDPFTFIAIIFLLSIILFPPKCELLNTTAWLSRFLNLNEIVRVWLLLQSITGTEAPGWLSGKSVWLWSQALWVRAPCCIQRLLK